MRNLLIVLFFSILTLSSGYIIASASGVYFAAGLVSVILAVIAFFYPKLGFAILIFSMLLSPEISVGALSGSRDIVFRYDDIFLAVIFLAWLARSAIFKGKGFVFDTRAQLPILFYAALCVASTALGVIRGELTFLKSLFYVLKYIEYFMIYFMAVNIIDGKEDIKKYLKYGLLVLFAVTIYAYYFYYGTGMRASAPFEASLGSPQESEPASLGGYYIIVLSVVFAALTEYSGAYFIYFLLLSLFIMPVFLFTFSRASYIGLTFSSIALPLLSKRRKLTILTVLTGVFIIYMFVPTLSQKVKERIKYTYEGEYATDVVNLGFIGKVKLEKSAAMRVRSIKRAIFEKFPKHPLFGWGVTGVGLGDSQYALIIGELGALGVIIFIWMIYIIFISARRVYIYYEEKWIKALALGLSVSLIGLLFQAIGVNTFIIVRIMEPFWVLTAFVMYLDRKIPKEDEF